VRRCLLQRPRFFPILLLCSPSCAAAFYKGLRFLAFIVSGDLEMRIAPAAVAPKGHACADGTGSPLRGTEVIVRADRNDAGVDAGTESGVRGGAAAVVVPTLPP
jgi:hypothetical protein